MIYRVLAAALGVFVATSAVAQNYPAKPIRIIAAQSAGGVSDALARTFAQKFNEAWKQPVVVENRAGAGGRTRAVNRAPACGM